MSYYWQAKLWGLLHDPALKALHDRTGRSKEGLWTRLAAMQGWSSPKAEGSPLRGVGDADLIASASDRAAIGHLPVAIDYQVEDRGQGLGSGLEMSHLLSGRKHFWQLADDQHQALKDARSRADYLMEREESAIPDWVWQEEDPQKVFWWFWRCFPQAICQEFGDESLLLLPAETRLPDGSLWSHASVTAALAGCLAGYEEPKFARPFLVSFTFNPIQELIKASRKMRDFWAGSWLLHYLSARISWRLAEKYGPDCLLYPSLYGQPLIDYWLREKYPEFEEWIPQPSPNALLTAGFPNVLLLLLPEERVEAAMQFAQQTLKEEWKQLAQRVLDYLQGDRRWLRQLHPEDPTWQGWLEHQWQHYWAAVPLGSPAHSLKDTGILKPPHVSIDADPWVSAQNRTYHLGAKQKLFADEELEFLRASFWDPQRQQRRQYKAGLNVGSWWAAAVEQSRRLQAACKQARDWQLPVAFGPRSTVSGLGPVVHPSPREGWITEGESRRLWQRQAGLFDGREQLNATETLKRGLYKVLPELFRELDEDQIAASYPDLTAGVAGYLKTQGRREREHFEQACQAVEARYPEVRGVLREMRGKWGIPWADRQNLRYHPRLLNAGWLVEDLELDEETQRSYRQDIETLLGRYYPSVNPASWYVLAAGDGDDMGKWLRGEKMKSYYDYLPQPLQRLANGQTEAIGEVFDKDKEELEQVKDAFQKFVKNSRKRMGPATHSALSRALLDFSGQLVPYLTEQRYAGKLIYAGGDDVLAYTNLWEWDGWLWDIRQCFRGGEDDWREFENLGDYWQWKKGRPPEGLSRRPLFTLGSAATISFGVVIAHHSVPLAIALENLWQAEEEAKGHLYAHGCPKDSVQVRVLFANGNQLVSTCKFDTFDKWKDLLDFDWKLMGQQQDQSSLFEQAAQLWEQHPAPSPEAVPAWATLFCSRRDLFKQESEQKEHFQNKLVEFIQHFWQHSLPAQPQEWDLEIKNWFKLAAFVLRNRTVKLGRNGR